MRICIAVGAVALASLASVGAAQTLPQIEAPTNIIPPSGLAFKAADGKSRIASPTDPLPVATRGEAFQLVTANATGPAVTLVGGTYVLTQLCTGYGTVTLRYRGPDGATMVGMLSKTAADSGGGTAVSFGTGAIVDVTLSGTTGCNVALARIP